MTESNIIQGCQDFDKTYQKELVVRYTPFLKTVCRIYVGEEDAKDILQESFIIILSKINTYKPIGPFKGWMRQITVRCALAHLKKRKRIQSYENKVSREMHVRPMVFESLNQEEIIGLLQSLSEIQKVIFSLNVIEGYSHKEIANLLDINEATSRSHLLRARKYLQKKLSSNKEEQLVPRYELE